MLPPNRRIAILLGVVATIAAWTTATAVAQSADTYIERGLKSYAKKDYQAAAKSFEAAHELDPRPSTLFAWAQALRLGGDCRAALALFGEFLASSPSSEDRVAAERAMKICVDKTKHMPPTKPRRPADVGNIARKPQNSRPRTVARVHETDTEVMKAVAEPDDSGSESSEDGSSREGKSIHVFSRIDFDSDLTGAVLVPGVGLRLDAGVWVFGAGLVGSTRGVELGSRFCASDQRRMRPCASFAMPIFFLDGARPGLRAALGTLFSFGNFGATIDAGISRVFNAPMDLADTVFVGSIGVVMAL